MGSLVMPCQAKAYEPARILEAMLLMHCGRLCWACPTSLKIRSTNATCVQIHGKKVYGIHQYTMSQAHVRSKSNFLCATFHTSLAPLVRSHRIELDKSSNATGLPKAMVKMGGARPLETLGSRISENSGNPAWGVYIMLHWYILTCHQITIKSPGVNLGPGMIRDSPRCVNK